MVNKEKFNSNYKSTLKRIADICVKYNRNPDEVELLPVTKNHPKEAIVFSQKAGSYNVGENRIQETIDKINTLGPINIQWELIGHLQSNKVKLAVTHFDRIQTVDSFKLVKKLNDSAKNINKVQRILLQFNAGSDPKKFGASLESANELMETALNLDNIKIEGLMTIAPLSDDINVARTTFANLQNLKSSLEEKFDISLPVLSMGMSGDLEAAIEMGSTMVRVGTGLFGERDYT